ncbi:hypothetical protein BXZ70DRAFT_644715 [Cristinia sonorae]|uniref:Fungal lipase-type domain-containing protein n=1 Tax=Cristinia sonorae TaxID=1940300 RepID=A0A8K0XKQ2_9AGAR|nr:hypothetical protein BXZ70DRAFT_644715 [Cristinia sonorae]
MVGQLAIIHQQKQDAQFHFTGHSLGGAYCTLTYGEFLRRQTEAPFSTFKFGDMYSVAAPRVCEQPFAAQVTVHTGPGKLAFRIVNKEDPVPTFPPRTEDQLVEYLFVHVDGGWHLLDASQERMATEQPPDGYPVPPKSIPSTIWDATDHRKRFVVLFGICAHPTVALH